MDILLIRHGEPVSGPDCGSNPGLTELGRAQAALMASHISNEPIDVVYVSPQLRARQTAGPLAEALGLEPVVEERIAEFDYGDDRYIAPSELPNLSAEVIAGLRARMKAPEFLRRVRDGFETIVGSHSEGRVAVVCHGVVINTIVRNVVGSDQLHMRAGHCSATRLQLTADGRWILEALNERHWLQGSGP